MLRWPLLLLLLLPTAQACSLGGPVPGPGVFIAWEPGDPPQSEVVGVVHRPSLSGECGLSNDFVWNGEVLVHREKGKWIVTDRDGDRRRSIEPPEDPVQMGLSTEALFAAVGGFGTPVRVYRYDLDTLEPVEVTHPLGTTQWYGKIHGSVAAWLDDGEVGAYDLESSRWLVEPTTTTALGLPDHARLRAANPDWLLFTASDGQYRSPSAYAYGIRAESIHSLHGADIWTFALDGHTAYFGDGEITAWNLLLNTMHDLETPGVPFLGSVRDGRLLLGSFSVTWVDPIEDGLGPLDLPRAQWIPTPASSPLVAVALLVALRVRRTYL